MDGEPEAALDCLELTIVSVSEQQAPATHETGISEAACHHHPEGGRNSHFPQI